MSIFYTWIVSRRYINFGGLPLHFITRRGGNLGDGNLELIWGWYFIQAAVSKVVLLRYEQYTWMSSMRRASLNAHFSPRVSGALLTASSQADVSGFTTGFFAVIKIQEIKNGSKPWILCTPWGMEALISRLAWLGRGKILGRITTESRSRKKKKLNTCFRWQMAIIIKKKKRVDYVSQWILSVVHVWREAHLAIKRRLTGMSGDMHW